MFEWDPRKAEADAVRHGVAFDDAVTLPGFATRSTAPIWSTRRSSRDSAGLDGLPDGQLFMVAYALRRRGDAEAIRIISARRARRRERAAYAAKD